MTRSVGRRDSVDLHPSSLHHRCSASFQLRGVPTNFLNLRSGSVALCFFLSHIYPKAYSRESRNACIYITLGTSNLKENTRPYFIPLWHHWYNKNILSIDLSLYGTAESNAIHWYIYPPKTRISYSFVTPLQQSLFQNSLQTMVSLQPFELLHFPKHAKAHHLQSHRGSVTLNMPIPIPLPVIHRLTDLSVTVHSF